MIAMKNTISVIIPVYNVKTYLDQCLKSVLSQSYSDLQVLVIDDGSTDGSGEICDSYAKADSRVQVIHQPNGGAAAAKNTGLKFAQGEYLAFLDSDDYLEENAYQYMVDILNQTGADAVQCGYRNVYADGAEDVVMHRQRQVFSTTDYLRRYTTDWTCGLLWDKLYRRSLAQNVFFEEGHIIDDEFFTYRLMMAAKTLVCDPFIVCNYRQRRSGVMRSESSAQRIVMDKLTYLPQRRLVVTAAFPELSEVFDLHYLNFLLLLSRDPYATERSLLLEKELLGQYRGTKPPMGLWLPLWRLRRTPVSKLMKKRNVPPQPENRQYFD